jgi:hypothetical protein
MHFLKLLLSEYMYSVTSEKRTPTGLAKKFGIWKFPEFRNSELSEQVETLKHQLFKKEMMKNI